MKYKDIPVPKGLIAFTISNFPTWENGTIYQVYITTDRDLELGFKRSSEARDNGDVIFCVGLNNTVQLCMDRIGEDIGNCTGEPNKRIIIENFGRMLWAIDQSGDAKEFFKGIRSGHGASIGLCFDDAQQNIELSMALDKCTVLEVQAEYHARSLQETYDVVKRYREQSAPGATIH